MHSKNDFLFRTYENVIPFFYNIRLTNNVSVSVFHACILLPLHTQFFSLEMQVNHKLAETLTSSGQNVQECDARKRNQGRLSGTKSFHFL